MKMTPQIPLEIRFHDWKHKFNYIRKALANKQYVEQGIKPLAYDENILRYIVENYTYVQIEKVFFSLWEYNHNELWQSFISKFTIPVLETSKVEYWLQDETIDKLWQQYSSKVEANRFTLDNFWSEETKDFYT